MTAKFNSKTFKKLAKGIESENMETVKTAKSMLEQAKKQRSEIENEKKS